MENAPQKLIAVFIGLSVVGAIATALWSGILTKFSEMGALTNFSFSSLVGGGSTTLSVILLSVVLIGAVMGMFGYTIYSKGKR